MKVLEVFILVSEGDCDLQTQCMKKPVKDQGRQVSFLNEEQEKVTCLDLMKQKIDSPEGRRMYSRRMWTIEPVFGNITSNKGLSRISVRGEAKATANVLHGAQYRKAMEE